MSNQIEQDEYKTVVLVYLLIRKCVLQRITKHLELVPQAKYELPKNTGDTFFKMMSSKLS